MCVVKTPKIPNSPEDNKPLPILRNPFLDGLLGNIAATRDGRNSLRIPLNPLGIPVGGGVGGGGGGGGGIGGGGSAPSSGGTSSGEFSGGGGGSTGSTSGSKIISSRSRL